jgi:hypothetical protein
METLIEVQTVDAMDMLSLSVLVLFLGMYLNSKIRLLVASCEGVASKDLSKKCLTMDWRSRGNWLIRPSGFVRFW